MGNQYFYISLSNHPYIFPIQLFPQYLSGFVILPNFHFFHHYLTFLPSFKNLLILHLVLFCTISILPKINNLSRYLIIRHILSQYSHSTYPSGFVISPNFHFFHFTPTFPPANQPFPLFFSCFSCKYKFSDIN